jgi:hypothetical protein
VQQILREQGVRHVQSIGRAVESEEVRPAPPLSGGYSDHRSGGRPDGVRGLIDLLPSLRSTRPAPELPRVVEVPMPQQRAPAAPATVGEDEMPAFPFRRPGGDASRSVSSDQGVVAPVRPQAVLSAVDVRTLAEGPRLPAEAIRLLKATLFELGECRRLLDSGRGEPN